MAKRRDIIIGMIILFSFVGFVFLSIIALTGIQSSGSFDFSFGQRVAIIDISGGIYSARDVVRQIKKYTDDSSVPAIVLRINSPGGGAAPSHEIYSQLLRAKDEGKVIVAFMESVAASGGYYVAVAADTIVANPEVLTGSIGVILEYQTFERLSEKIGIETETIQAGELKSSGSMWHAATDQELDHLQSVVDDAYEQFLEIVAEGRDMELEDVRALGEGRIYTGRQAFEVNLVDILGDFDEALNIAADMTGLEAPPLTIREIKRRGGSIWDLLGETVFGVLTGMGSSMQNMPQLLFLYR